VTHGLMFSDIRRLIDTIKQKVFVWGYDGHRRAPDTGDGPRHRAHGVAHRSAPIGDRERNLSDLEGWNRRPCRAQRRPRKKAPGRCLCDVCLCDFLRLPNGPGAVALLRTVSTRTGLSEADSVSVGRDADPLPIRSTTGGMTSTPYRGIWTSRNAPPTCLADPDTPACSSSPVHPSASLFQSDASIRGS